MVLSTVGMMSASRMPEQFTPALRLGLETIIGMRCTCICAPPWSP